MHYRQEHRCLPVKPLRVPSQSSLILHFIHNGPSGLLAVAERQTRAAAGAADAPAELSPTLEPTHYVAGCARQQANDADEASRPTVAAAALPSVLAITEWPAERTKAEALGTAAGACDFLVFVVDQSDEGSMSFFSDHVQLVPDGVPVLVVASQRAVPRNMLQRSSEALKELCCEKDDKASGPPPLGLEVFSFRPSVRGGSAAWGRGAGVRAF